MGTGPAVAAPTAFPRAADRYHVSAHRTADHAEGVGRREIETAARRWSGAGRRRLRRVGVGLLGGLLATVTMTVFRMPISDSPPPTADLWARYVGDGGPEDHLLVGLLLHLGYGTAAGGLFGALAPVPPTGTELSREVRGVLAGLAYGLLLSAFGERALLVGLLGMDLEADERFVFHASHVVYGLTIGAWVGSRAE